MLLNSIPFCFHTVIILNQQMQLLKEKKHERTIERNDKNCVAFHQLLVALFRMLAVEFVYSHEVNIAYKLKFSIFNSLVVYPLKRLLPASLLRVYQCMCPTMLFVMLSMFWFLALLLSPYRFVPFLFFSYMLFASFRVYLRNADNMVVLRIYFDIMWGNAKHILIMRWCTQAFESISVFYCLNYSYCYSVRLYCIFSGFLCMYYTWIWRDSVSEWERERLKMPQHSRLMSARFSFGGWWLPLGSISHTWTNASKYGLEDRLECTSTCMPLIVCV